ncbi:MAG: hypothetical protein PWP72_389 [Thermoanaerobacter sp.]|jgi:hypothetical protein|uniref:AbrB/MazE/SpoVT family DNA-binding domain-containing protein n=1 Tax=Desulfofundulus thermocisternus TaxID=42471 RepID=UPI000480BDFD|nr:AbrB/MazE/SpoVT family DNA-binding domain-containing protein [Desulfofundulus thermocisternus]MDK2887511.1 hypothetical protein [Thermoanaerobacter sp.]
MKITKVHAKSPGKRAYREAKKREWVLKLNPKGQATIPLEVRRMLGVEGVCRELKLVAQEDGFRLLPHKPPPPIQKYIGCCAEELADVNDAAAFVRELRGRESEAGEA